MRSAKRTVEAKPPAGQTVTGFLNTPPKQKFFNTRHMY